jgi:hypothetical protein
LAGLAMEIGLLVLLIRVSQITLLLPALMTR